MRKKAEDRILKRLCFVKYTLGIVLFAVVAVRLFYMQVIKYDFYQTKAIEQQTRDKTLYARRGTIYDTNMKPLAISADTEMVTIEAAKIDSPEQGILIAEKLSQLLELNYEKVLATVEKKATYAELKKGVEKEITDQIRVFIKENKIDSIYMVPDSKRYYPFGNFASHVLGFVGADEQGLNGIEAKYNEELTGTAGRVITATNPKGEEMPFAYEMYYDAQNGDNLVLTIDEVIQHYLEKNLEIALHDNNVQNKVAGVIMDIKTGGILAMAQKPDYDPNAPFTITDEMQRAEVEALTGDAKAKRRSDILNEQWRNKTLSDAYDPGSTFKILTASMALEEGTISENSTFFCPGYKQINKWRISCWKTAGHGSQVLAEAIKNSCNPAFMEIGQSVGIDNFKKYMEAFGLRAKTGIDLTGESSGVFFKDMNATDLAVASFGQNFSVTPVQLLTAVSAVANGGTMMKPHVVKEVVDSAGNVKQNFDSRVVRQVVSENTSKQMSKMLENVVTSGTGKNAYVMGYRVAGKTGTSEKKSKQLIYGKKFYVTSFVAFAPADDPQVAILITLDEPTVLPITGGVNTAPVVRRVLEEVMPYLNIEPIYTEAELEKKDVAIPDLMGKTKAEAESILKNQKINYRTEGTGEAVTGQVPAAGAVVSSKAEVILYMGKEVPQTQTTVPDLYGMTTENVRRTLQNLGLYLQTSGAINGSGDLKALRQSVPKGTKINIGSVVIVEFSDLSQMAH